MVTRAAAARSGVKPLGGTYQINLLFRLIGPEGPHEAKERILRGLRNSVRGEIRCGSHLLLCFVG